MVMVILLLVLKLWAIMNDKEYFSIKAERRNWWRLRKKECSDDEIYDETID